MTVVLALGGRVWGVLVFAGALAAGACRSPAGPARRGEPMPMEKSTHATGRTEVKAYVPTTFDTVEGGPKLLEVQLTETFSGDVEGEGIGRVIQAVRGDGSATFTGLERVRGTLAGRRGTFLLDVRGTVAGKAMNAQWSVVAGSGTGELAGLRGDGGFTAEIGRHGSIWLDYFFGG